MKLGKIASYALIGLGMFVAFFSGLLTLFALTDAEDPNPLPRVIILVVGVILGCVLGLAGWAGARSAS